MTQETFETKSTLVDNLTVIELDLNKGPDVRCDPPPAAVDGVDVEECDLRMTWVDLGGCLEDIQCPVYLDHHRLRFHDTPDLLVGGVSYLSHIILY